MKLAMDVVDFDRESIPHYISLLQSTNMSYPRLMGGRHAILISTPLVAITSQLPVTAHIFVLDIQNFLGYRVCG
jgi:hypothetical protein